MVDGLRRFIFTDRERELLKTWLETGEESNETRKLLTRIRKGFPDLAEDMEIMFAVIRELMRRRRWRGRVTGSCEFGSTLRRAESALTRVRRGGAT